MDGCAFEDCAAPEPGPGDPSLDQTPGCLAVHAPGRSRHRPPLATGYVRLGPGLRTPCNGNH
eukprot:scaffold47996_cov19-Prasinocladus_malaysianus.AAC.1